MAILGAWLVCCALVFLIIGGNKAEVLATFGCLSCRQSRLSCRQSLISVVTGLYLSTDQQTPFGRTSYPTTPGLRQRF